jgi:hypothetical protein
MRRSIQRLLLRTDMLAQKNVVMCGLTLVNVSIVGFVSMVVVAGVSLRTH